MESTPSKAAEDIVLRWDSTASEEARHKMIFESDREEIDRYLHAVDEIQRSVSSLSLSNNQFKSNSTIQIAMARLEDELRNILITQTNPIEADSLTDPSSATHSASSSITDFQDEKEGEAAISVEDDSPSFSGSPSYRSNSRSSYRSTSSIRQIDLIPSDAVFDLRCIVERMISVGYVRECIQVYANVRKSTFDASFQMLGVEKLNKGDIQKLEWAELEKKIRRWIRAARVCVRILFASEKKLCEQIFYGIGTVLDDACFMETVKGPAIQLFSFAEAISQSGRAPEKLFKMLDLHDALMEMKPDVEEIFESKSAESIRVQATEILSRLGETVRGIIPELEHAVHSEPSLVPVPGGTIHPLTRYVMNYVGLISDYKRSLSELIVSKPSSGSRYSSDALTPEMEFAEIEGKSPLELHLIWMIVVLLLNLEGKSRHYKDASLAHLFIMNNAHYIVQKIKGSAELRELIGDSYLRRWTGKYTQAAKSYQRAAWVKVFVCLREEGLHVSGRFSSGISRSALREMFRSFNAAFEEVHRTHASWFVPDSQLRQELRISIAETLIPAYRAFLGRFRQSIESEKHPENYIKYTVEDLYNAVLDLFEECPSSHHLRRRS